MMIEDTDDYEPREGYSKAVDWWSLGVTMYELVVGNNPFAQANVVGFMSYVTADGAAPLTEVPPEYTQIFEALKKATPSLSAALVDCVSQFLHVDCRVRLGSGTGGVHNIKKHALFEGLDWTDLHKMKIPPPFVPVCPPVVTTPLYDSFDVMMKKIGKPAWMEPFKSGNYYNNW